MKPTIGRLSDYLRDSLGENGAESVVIRALPLEGPARAALINADRPWLDKLPYAARNAADRLAESGRRTPIAITAPFADIGELRAACDDGLLRLLDYSFYLPDLHVLVPDRLPAPGPRAESFNLNRFTEEFKRGQFRQAFDYMRRHVEALAADYTSDAFGFKSFLGNLVFNITVLLGNMEYDVKALENNKYRHFKAIEEARFASDALTCLDVFIGEAEACISDKAAQPGNANMKKLLDYIHEHYAEPLNLTDMAKHFHFNPSYLSSYFSTHNNEGFVDYLHKVRIEKAEELLRKGDAMISEISGLVGYSDHSYFCKVFKKLTGLSPSRYRRQFMGEEKGLT